MKEISDRRVACAASRELPEPLYNERMELSLVVGSDDVVWWLQIVHGSPLVLDVVLVDGFVEALQGFLSLQKPDKKLEEDTAHRPSIVKAGHGGSRVEFRHSGFRWFISRRPISRARSISSKTSLNLMVLGETHVCDFHGSNSLGVV